MRFRDYAVCGDLRAVAREELSLIVSDPRGPKMQFFPATRARCSRGVPCVGCMGQLTLVELWEWHRWQARPRALAAGERQSTKMPPASPVFLERVAAGSCCFSRCFTVSKRFSFMYSSVTRNDIVPQLFVFLKERIWSRDRVCAAQHSKRLISRSK